LHYISGSVASVSAALPAEKWCAMQSSMGKCWTHVV